MSREQKPTRIWGPRLITNFGTYLILSVVAIVAMVPLVYTLFASLKPLPEILNSGAQLFPQTWTFENYVKVWQVGGVAQYFANSVFVVVLVVGIDLCTSSLLGYLMARKMLPFQRVVEGVLAATLFVGLGTATLFPRYVIAQHLGIANLIGVALVEVSGLTTVHAFLIRAFCESLPIELEEAARVDGAGLIGTFRRIVFPLLTPILATTAILGFQAAWNNFQVPYVFTLSDPNLRTLVVGVYSLRSTAEGSQAFDLMLAGAMIVIVPIALAFLFLQRYFVRGMTEGAVK